MILHLILSIILVAILAYIAYTQQEERLQIAFGVFVILLLIKGTL